MKLFCQNLPSWHMKIFAMLCIVAFTHMPQIAYSEETSKNKASEKPLVLGVIPFTLPGPLLKRFSNLRDYLSENLGRKVVVKTAPDFKKFVQRTAQRQYDIVWTPPHFVLLALDTGHYDVVVTWNRLLETVFVVPENSKVRSIKQLAGQSVATPPNTAIVTLFAKYYIEQSGLFGNTAPLFEAYKGHDASYMAAITGKSNAAVTEISMYKHAIANGVSLRIIERLPKIPGVGILLAKDLPEKQRMDIKKLLINIQSDMKGQQAIDASGFPAYRETRAEEFRSIPPFLRFLPELKPENKDAL